MPAQKWLFTVEPFDDELLSSWLTRTAKANFTTVIGLFSQHWAGKSYFNKDIDIFDFPESFWKTLSECTGVSVERIYQMRLKNYEGYIQEKISGKGREKWIVTLSHGVRYDQRARAFCYCPFCLQENPYYKKEWKLYFVNACLKHHCILETQCPHCHTSVDPVYTEVDQKITVCFRCGNSLLDAKPLIIPSYSDGFKALKRCLNICKRGYFLLNGRWYYSMSFFYVLRIFTRHMSKYNYLRGYPNKTSQKQNFPSDYTTLQMFYIIKRSVELFKNWPESCQQFFQGHHLKNKPRILEKLERKNNCNNVPFWFLQALKEFVEVIHPLSEDEVNSIKEYLSKNGKLTAKRFAEMTGYQWDSGYRYLSKLYLI